MARIFTNYPDRSDIFSTAEKESNSQKDKEFKKLKRKIKKLEKIVRKMERKSMEESEFASESGRDEKKQEKKFGSKIADAFLHSLPTIFQNAVKIVVPILCECFARRFGKVKMA